MKRALHVTALLAMGLLVASSHARAQDVPTASSGGSVSIRALGAENIKSAEFEKYREVPEGISIPFMNLFATNANLDFDLRGYNVRQKDQQYTGWFNTSYFGLSWDYNQTPHNKGNDGRTIFSELSTGVWAVNTTLRRSLGATVDATPTAARTVSFYDALLGPTFEAANKVDISSVRKRGTLEVDLGANLPFDLAVTYMREARTGYRGVSGEDILGNVSPVIALPEPLDDRTQDFGVRAAYAFAMGNVHAAVNRNLYNNNAETFVFDNPFQAVDVAFTAAAGSNPAFGGPSRARIILAPDNEATTASGGFLLKFARQTRLSGDVARGRWTQNADFYPHTINSTILTPAGVRADSLQALQQSSFDGKLNSTTLNFTFTSRPVKGLGLRANYRSYELANKTDRYVITGDVSGSPDRSWGTVTASADAPYGHATANVYDSKTKRFKAGATYDIGPLTVEAGMRLTGITRTSREATEGGEDGYTMAAVFHANEWLGVRASYDYAKRTIDEGTTVIGYQADEAERKTKRTVIDVEVTPIDAVSFTFAFGRRDVDYPNRPGRVAGDLSTTVGLLEAKYDSYTGEVTLTPNDRAEISAFYTYEKDTSTNRWATLTSGRINNMVQYDGRDETDTFGANAVLQLVPEKWTCTLSAQRQKVDGLMDVTANPTGSFFTSRATVGGPQAIEDYDDTKLTTIQAQLDYTLAKAWTLAMGYWYEKYDFKDAYTSGDLLMPQAVLIFMKANDGDYKANVAYATLSYKF